MLYEIVIVINKITKEKSIWLLSEEDNLGVLKLFNAIERIDTYAGIFQVYLKRFVTIGSKWEVSKDNKMFKVIRTGAFRDIKKIEDV